MKIQYHLPLLSFKERILYHNMLLDELDRQDWYIIIANPLTGKEEALCIQ